MTFTNKFSRRELIMGLRTVTLDYPPLYTPIDEVYYSPLTTYPIIAPEHWRLTIVDKAAHRTSYSLNEMRAMDAVDLGCTIFSSTASAREPMIANALWRGVWLRDLLRGTPPNLRVISAHGRLQGIPASMAERTLLAYQINGIDLPAEQGAPLRIIIPGVDDRWMPGWVRRIELMSAASAVSIEDHSIRAVMFEPPAVAYSAPISLRGYAYAGLQPIDEISVRLDDGDWLPLDFVAGDLGVWSRWRYQWHPQHPGIVNVQVRARAAAETTITQRIIRVETA